MTSNYNAVSVIGHNDEDDAEKMMHRVRGYSHVMVRVIYQWSSVPDHREITRRMTQVRVINVVRCFDIVHSLVEEMALIYGRF